jgi:NAD(P)-dependent dehydrogenase (short-subunit alcohol dehydrogenase family)
VAHGLAETTAGAGATLDSVLPGSTDSEGVTTFVGKMAETQGRSEMEDEFFRSDRPSSLLGRFIEPEEVAVVVAYGSSPLSSTTNVASLRAGGGVVRSIF